jgi:vacuolar-type H+-ATPase subunit E/Vma4
LGLSQLKNELIGDAKGQAKDIALETEAEKKEIFKEAEKQKQAVLEQAEKEATALVEDEKREQFAAIQLKAKRLVSEAKEETVNKNMGDVWTAFAKASKDANYPQLLRKLIEEGVEALGDQAMVQVNSKDVSTAKKFARKVSAVSGLSGGAIITSQDGRISINNSLEALFEERRDDIRRMVFGQLFTGKEFTPAQPIIRRPVKARPKAKAKKKAPAKKTVKKKAKTKAKPKPKAKKNKAKKKKGKK